MKFFDKNYDELYVGADVSVPTPITLKEYADLVGVDKNIEPKTLQEIQDYVEEHHEVTLWDYPLDELDYCKEEDMNVILVETDFGLRFCEIS